MTRSLGLLGMVLVYVYCPSTVFIKKCSRLLINYMVTEDKARKVDLSVGRLLVTLAKTFSVVWWGCIQI